MTEAQVLQMVLELTKESVQLNKNSKCCIDVHFFGGNNFAEFFISETKEPESKNTLYAVQFNSKYAETQIEKIKNAFEFIKQHDTWVDIDEVENILQQ